MVSSLFVSFPGSSGQERGLRPPCQLACPIHQDVQRYAALISQGQFDSALAVIRETNPLPLVCGLVCSHQCQTECRRGRVDQAISIRALKRAAAEFGSGSSSSRARVKFKEEVAIIGSGPAGLSAAFYLANLGYKATIFEALPLPGGMMRYGIPTFRLPRAILDAEINQIKGLGVIILTNTAINSLDELFLKGFRAIFIASGAPKGVKLGIAGGEAPEVMDCLSFLRKVNSGEKVRLGNRVAVIGGGNAAIDSARTAMRLGAQEVTIVYRRGQAEMPATAEEVDEAVAEWVRIMFLVTPKRISKEDGSLKVELVRTKLGIPDATGRPRPEAVSGSEFSLDFDFVIVAIGQTSEIPKQLCLAKAEGGRLVVDPDSLSTQRDGVFAGGDVVTGPASVVQAIAAGKQAALSIDCYLKGRAVPKSVEPITVGELPAEAAQRLERLKRQKMPARMARKRISNFELVEQGYTKAMSIREASRCLNCGSNAKIISDKCIACLTCVRICPYGAPGLNPNSDVEISPQRCIACGLCDTECPAGAIELQVAGLEDLELSIETALKGAAEDKAVILGLFCSYGTLAESWQQQNHPRVRIVNIPCVSRIAVNHLLRAFELGAGGVFIAACGSGDCRYRDATDWAALRVAETKRVLGQVGFGEERLRLFRLPPFGIKELDKPLAEFVEEVGGLSRVKQKKGGK